MEILKTNFKLFADDWGDIEGPASPPKPSAGSIQVAMETKNKPIVATETQQAQPLDEQFEELNMEDSVGKETVTVAKDSRVPENGTPIATEIDQAIVKETSMDTDSKTVAKDSDLNNVIQTETADNSKTQNIVEQNTGSKTDTAKSKDKSNLLPSGGESKTPEMAAVVKQEKEVTSLAASSGGIEKPVEPPVVDIQSEPAAAAAPQQDVVPPPVTAAAVEPPASLTKPLTVNTELKTRDKGDMVVVGSERTTPSSDSTGNKGNSSKLFVIPI